MGKEVGGVLLGPHLLGTQEGVATSAYAPRFAACAILIVLILIVILDVLTPRFITGRSLVPLVLM